MSQLLVLGTRRAHASTLVRLACVLLLLAGVAASAQVTCPGGAKTWIGAAGAAWNTGSNWSPNGAPGAGGDACFNTANPSPTLPNGNTAVGGIYILAGTNLTVTGGAGTGNFRVAGSLSADGTFTFTGGAASLRINQVQTWLVNSTGNSVTWPMNGGARLTKTGPGSVVFSGAGSTHNGGLTISAGELRFNGSYANADGSVTVSTGATLSGSGEVQAATTVAAGGIYTPGAGGTGTLSTLGLTLNNTSSLNFTVGTSTTSGTVTGALVLDGVLNITAGTGFAQGTYTLFTASGTITNNSLTLGTAPAGFSYDYQVSGASVLLKVGPPATAVELLKLDAESAGGAAEVSWEAGTEIRNLGYRVHREENGQRREVSGLIAGSALRASFDPLAGRNYSFVDPGGRSGAIYWIEAIDLRGKSEWFGPVQTRAGTPSRVRSSALVANLGASPLLIAQGGSGGQPADPPGLDRSWGDRSLARQWDIAASSGAVKLLVQQDGVYRVPASQLFAAGLPVGAPLASLQLWAGGRAIAFRALAANGSSLQDGDALEFFGQAADTRYTGTRVYWVTQGLGAPTFIESAPAADATGSATSFSETLEIRERTLHVSGLRNTDTDGFFGHPIIGTRPMDRIFSTPALDVLAPEAATLEVSVQGLTAGAHTLDVLVNGVGVGTVAGSEQDVATAHFTIPPGALLPGDNTVSLVGRTSGEIALELSQRLTYSRQYAFSGPLRFTAPAGAQLALTGPDALAAHVLDITSAMRPASVLTAASSDGTSLVAAGSGSRILFAYRDRDVLAPIVVANSPSSWHSAQGADLVILGTRALLPSLRALADQRTREGLTVAVVDVEDVYDEFSAGEKDALAIRSFLSSAVRNWPIPPRYVLLAGAATYDPRGWLGRPELDQVPTVLVWTRYIEAASDDALVTFDPSKGPELAIGRLPAANPADMDAAVAKILGRKLATPTDSLLLVHDRDGNIPFSAATADVRSALSGWNARDFARGADDDATHTGLLEAMRAGPVAVDYQGHGAEDFWAGRILNTSDVDALSEAGSSSLLVAATCLNAYFVDIGREALGSALLRTPNGGAWGVWASSALTLPTDHALLSRTLLSAVLDEGLTLGEATLKAKQAVTDPDVRASFHLLGDPSARAVAVKSSALSTTSTPKSGAAGCSTTGAPMAALAPLILAAVMLSARRRRPT
ncbi:MAG: C25 family cysteine peptidase [Myxococcaceae bacterium]